MCRAGKVPRWSCEFRILTGLERSGHAKVRNVGTLSKPTRAGSPRCWS